MIVRARHDRATTAKVPLFWLAQAKPGMVVLKDVVESRVPPRGPGDAGRTPPMPASRRGRSGRVRPKNANAGMRDSAEKTLALGYIEVREVEPPAGVPALCWRLLTTLPIATRQDVTCPRCCGSIACAGGSNKCSAS